MKKFAAATITMGAVAGAMLGLAHTATAAPVGSGSAEDVVKNLQDQGYVVRLNGSANAPLSQCVVSGVHGLRGTEVAGMADPARLNVVYVDVVCPCPTDVC